MSRDTILGRIRAATAKSKPPPTLTVPPPRSLTVARDHVQSRFQATATDKGVIVVDLAGKEYLPEAVARALPSAPDGIRHIRINDPALTCLAWEAAGIAVTDGAAGAHDQVALSRAIAGVAETGSVILASGQANPTTLALLPATHLVALERTSIAGTSEDALALLDRIYARNLPRAVNIISGASRTGDIGGRIVHGAQGPRRLIVFLL
jgi:L-lactate dehydrogenase complex protein LldG